MSREPNLPNKRRQTGLPKAKYAPREVLTYSLRAKTGLPRG